MLEEIHMVSLSLSVYHLDVCFGMFPPALLSGPNLLTAEEVGGFSHLPTVVAWAHLEDEHGKEALRGILCIPLSFSQFL